MAENEAVFTEILEIRADQSAFEQSLTTLTDAYQKWLAGLGEGSAVNIGSAGIAQALADMSSKLGEFGTAATALLENFVIANTAASTKITESSDATTQAQLTNLQKIQEKTEQVDGGITRAQIRLNEASRQNATASAEVNSAPLDVATKIAAVEDQILLTKQRIQQLASVVTPDIETAQALEDQTKAMNALIKLRSDYNALLERQVKLDQDISIEREGIANKEAEAIRKLELMYTAMFDKISADQERVASSQKKFKEELSIEQEGVANLAAEKQAKAQEQLNSELVKTAELEGKLSTASLGDNFAAKIDSIKARLEILNQQIREFQSISSKTTGTNTSEAAADQGKYNELLSKQLGLVRELSSAENALATERNRAAKSSESAIEKFLTSFPKQIAMLALWQVEWAAISGIINGIGSIIGAPFAAIQEGITYLEKADQQAARLSGTLASNVKYSSDLNTNFKIAQQVAGELYSKLAVDAAKYNVEVDALQRVFESLASSNAVLTTNTAGELEQVAVKFTAAMLASGQSATTVRTLVAQIPKAFEGSLAATSTLALALGISSSHLQDIIASSKIHHNLLEQIAPLLESQVLAQEANAKTHEGLVKTIQVEKEQLEAIAARPLTKVFDDFLVRLLDFYKENKIFVDQWATNLGTIAATIAKIAEVVLHILTGTGGISTELQRSALAAVDLAEAVLKVVTGFESLKKISDAANSTVVFNPFGDREASKRAAIEDDKALDDLVKQYQNLAKLRNDIKNGPTDDRGDTVGNEPDLLNKKFDGKEKPIIPATGSVKFKDDAKEFTAALEGIKEKYAEYVQDTKQAENDLVVSKTQAAQKTIELLKQERQEVEALAFIRLLKIDQEEKDQISKVASGPKGAKQIDDIEQTATDRRLQVAKTLAAFEIQTGKEIVAEKKIVGDQGRAYEAEFTKEYVANKSQEYNAQLAVIQLNQSEGKITPLYALKQEAAIRKQIHELAEQDLLIKLGATGFVSVEELAAYNALVLARKANAAAESIDDAKSEAASRDQTARILAQKDAFIQLGLTAEITAIRIASALHPLKNQIDALFKLDEETIAQDFNSVLARLQLALALAGGKETSEIRTLELSLAQTQQKSVDSLATQLQTINSNRSLPGPVQETFARSAIDSAIASTQANIANASAVKNIDPQLIKSLNNSLDLLRGELGNVSVSFKEGLGNFINKAAGFDVGAANQAIQSRVPGTFNGQETAPSSTPSSPLTQSQANIRIFSNNLLATSAAFQQLAGAVAAVQKGLASGGVLGGAGAAASQAGGIFNSLGAITQLGSAIPVIGSVLSAMGPVLSIVGDLFTAQAKRIGEQVKKSFQDTVTAFQNGNTDLADTIIALEQQRASAIARLSGVKGGQDQLNTLIPQFDNEIASLITQQKSIITTFDQANAQLALQSTTLAGVAAQWIAINKQVHDYLAAGGDAVTAAQTLALTLQQIQATAQDSLNQGNQTALTDAVNLNNLYAQRSALLATIIQQENTFNQTQFGLENSDSLERMKAGSVLRGQQIADNQAAYTIQKAQSQQQLESLNTQIALAENKVSLEGKVFDISTNKDQAALDNAAVLAAYKQEQADLDSGGTITQQHKNDLQIALATQLSDLAQSTAKLQTDTNKLTIDALTTQITQWTNLKTIIGSIKLGGAPGPGTSATGTGVVAPINNNFNITINGSDLTQGQVTDSITSALDQAARQGSPFTSGSFGAGY